MKLLRWFSDRFRDLFFGPGNVSADLGRIIAFLAVLMMLAGQVWNVILGLPIDLGPSGMGGGLAAVLGGTGALIYAKDRAKAENTAAKAMAAPEPVPKPTPKPTPKRRRKA